jgi:hypothetical protein
MHWALETGPKDIYGRAESVTWTTQTVRAHVAPVANHNVSGRPVTRTKEADVQDGDTVFLFEPTVDLSGKPQLWFEVVGLGNYVPESKPPQGADKHYVLFPSATALVQEVYCNVKRGA